tara:strand:+ start:74 stop:361 length:288 start_codon:yes stop_codon:yes gene_type:complete
MDISKALFDTFKGLEKCRYSMAGLQTGTIPRMEIKSSIPEAEQIAVGHDLLEQMRDYNDGLLNAGNAMAHLCIALEEAGIDLVPLKTMMGVDEDE